MNKGVVIAVAAAIAAATGFYAQRHLGGDAAPEQVAAAPAPSEEPAPAVEGGQIEADVIQTLLPRVMMRANSAFDSKPPLSQSRVTLRLRDGRVLTKCADGARGYPGRPASDEQLAGKFNDCARRSMPPGWSPRRLRRC